MRRRDFIKTSVVTAAGATLAKTVQAERSALERVTVASIGVRGRGRHLLGVFAARPDVDVKYVCDIDENVLGERTEQVTKDTGQKPERITDFRRALDDPEVDAVVVATPTHWHGIQTIMACQAGKDVYVEKPDAHNAIEGQHMVAAARKHQRVIQLGTQSRSGPYFQDMIEYIREGHLGRALFAKAWESNKQRSIGHPPDSDPPAGVDYDMWLGPAPQRPFNPRRFHANWRWFFDYGAGDLGNDGVHRMDLARWGFEAALEANGDPPLGPIQAVSAHGAKCYFDDMQEWPDNLVVTYDYGAGRVMTYEMRMWTPYKLDGEREGGVVYGDQGYLVIGNKRWRAFTKGNELVKEETGDYQACTVPHVGNFIECLRTREKPAADLETVGHPSSLMCHLGNAAWRAGHTIHFDFETYTCIGDDDANQYLARTSYRDPWSLPKLAQL